MCQRSRLLQLRTGFFPQQRICRKSTLGGGEEQASGRDPLVVRIRLDFWSSRLIFGWSEMWGENDGSDLD
jgi:hypothetical protein